MVQPTGDLAPQRRDTRRRTMGYATAEHAINDTATHGFSSTYHTRSEILEGSTIYLRKGEHEILRTLEARRSVTIRAEDGVVADDCKIVIKEISLLLSHASSVKVCAEASFRSLLLLKLLTYHVVRYHARAAGGRWVATTGRHIYPQTPEPKPKP